MLKKYKPKNYKKQLQEQNQSMEKLRKIIRNFSAEQWLHLIRTIDMKNLASMENYQYKGEFLVLVADTALRLSKPDLQASYPAPNSNDLKAIISLYFSYDQSPRKLIKTLGVAALPLIAAWQNRFHYPSKNVLGRIELLYSDYAEEIQDMIGVTTLDIQVIVLAIHTVYIDKEFIDFEAESLYSSEVGSLNKEKVDNFLDFFAIGINDYHAVAKSQKVYDNQIGTFNLMNRYPIIKIDESRYIIPSRQQLLESVAANLYFHILAHKQTFGRKASRKYLDEFGITLENYVVDLAKYVFKEKNVIAADDIVTNPGEDRCEVVCLHEGKNLAIEVKKLYFQRDAVSSADTEHIQESFDRHLAKGYNQVATTLKYTEGSKYGIIVIPDIMLSPSAILDYIKKDNYGSKTGLENRILVCTLSEYEQLMANDSESVFAALDIALKRTLGEGNSVSLILEDMKNSGHPIELANPYLDQIFSKKFKEQEKSLLNLK